MKQYFTILLVLLGIISCYAKDNVTKDFLSEISNGLFYNCDQAKHQLDSLRGAFSDDELKEYQAYLGYCDAFYHFQNYEYDEAFTMSNEALFSFVNNKEKDWEARCLLLIAFIAEKNRLTREALEAYSEAVLIANSNQILGLAYLGLARCQKRNEINWSTSYSKGIDYLALTDKLELELYSSYVCFWFYPDSLSLQRTYEELVEEYERLKFYDKASIIYKLLASHYLRLNQLPLADRAIDASFAMLNKDEKYSCVDLSESLFVDGQIKLAKGDTVGANSSFIRSTIIYDSIGQNHQNYYIYRYLVKLDTINDSFENAFSHTSMALKSYRSMSTLKTKWAREIRIILDDRQVLLKKLVEYKKHVKMSVICFVALIIVISTFVITRVIMRKRDTEQKLRTAKILMKDSIMEVKKKRFFKYVENSKSEIEQQIEKHLSKNKDLLENITTDSVDMILQVEQYMPFLSETEKKCVSLIALGCKNTDIAELLSVQVSTIKIYRSRIRKKLNMENSKADLRGEILRVLKID